MAGKKKSGGSRSRSSSTGPVPALFNTMFNSSMDLTQNAGSGEGAANQQLMAALASLPQQIADAVKGAVGGGSGGGGGGGGAGSQGGGSESSKLDQSAASRFLSDRAQGPSALGMAGRGLAAGAERFASHVGSKIAGSGLEVSASQTIKENVDPGTVAEAGVGVIGAVGGAAADSVAPGSGAAIRGAAKVAQGFIGKMNADADAKSGKTALQMARARLADIAGGLASRGATFSDSQLLDARNVLQARAQRDLDVRLQIRGLEDGIGAQRSGLGSGGHAR